MGGAVGVSGSWVGVLMGAGMNMCIGSRVRFVERSRYSVFYYYYYYMRL